MKTSQFFATHPVFSLHEATTALAPTGGRPGTVERLKYHLRSGTLKLAARGVYAVVPPGVLVEQFQPDSIMVASAVRPDGIFSHPSALELLGAAHSMWNQCTIYVEKRRRPLRLNGRTILFLEHPGAMSADSKQLGTVRVEQQGRLLRTTGPERTLVEGFRRPSLAGGLEELVRSASGFPTFDLDLIEIAEGSERIMRTSSPDLDESIVDQIGLWYDATTIEGLDDGDPVEEWLDKVMEWPAAQATVKNQPRYDEDVQNDLPAIHFDGSNDYLSCGDINMFTNAETGVDNPGKTLFVAAKLSGTSPLLTIIAKAAVLDYGWWIRPTQAANNDDETTYDPNDFLTPSPTIPSEVWVVVVLTWNPGDYTTLYNGNTLVGTTPTTCADMAETSTDMQIGSEFGAFFMNGYIGEIIDCPRCLTTADREAIVAYLNQKWDV